MWKVVPESWYREFNCIQPNNVNAHNLLPALIKLFDEQIFDKYKLQDHWESVYRCTFDI